MKAALPPRDDIAWRRFGPAFDRKCENPQVIVCARFACQQADRCQYTTQQERQ